MNGKLEFEPAQSHEWQDLIWASNERSVKVEKLSFRTQLAMQTLLIALILGYALVCGG